MYTASSHVWTFRPATPEIAARQKEVLQEERASMIRLARWRAHAQYGDESIYVQWAARYGWPIPEQVATVTQLVLEFQDLPWPKERTMRILGGTWPFVLGYYPAEKGPMLEHLAKVGNPGVKEAALKVLAQYRAMLAEAPALRAKALAERAKIEEDSKRKLLPPETPQSREIEFRPVELIWQDPKGQLVKIPRIIDCVPIRTGLDVVVVDRAVFLMKDKGRLRLVWNGPGYPSTACYDGRWVWFRSSQSHWSTQKLFVLDPESGKFWEITAKQGLPVAAAEDLPGTEVFQALNIAPLGPGKVCLAGSFGRTWIAIATFHPTGGAVKVFYEARELPNAQDEEQRKHTAVVFTPVAMYTLKSKPDASGHVTQRVLIARNKSMPPYGNWPPLVVDPEKLSVAVAPPTIPPNALNECRSYDGIVYGCTDQKYRKDGYGFFRLLYPDTFETLSTSFPVHGKIVLVGDRLNLLAEQWWTGSLARKEIHPVRAMPPEVEGVFPSAHYGLLFSSYDRSNKKFTNYRWCSIMHRDQRPDFPGLLANSQTTTSVLAPSMSSSFPGKTTRPTASAATPSLMLVHPLAHRPNDVGRLGQNRLAG
jgi:hypothetical protein